MKIVSSTSDATPDQPCVVSIGNFDGLHLGHRAILKTVVAQARELGLPSAVMTFEPHPIQVLAPDRAPRRITTLTRKIELIREAGIDLLLIVPFDTAFAQLSPESFVQQYLIDRLRARVICVGGNFNFGFRGAGNIETLKQWRGHFEVVEVPAVTVRGVAVSSTAIRQRVASGQVSRACRLLGRWIELEGAIVPGAGRGRRQTVPTFNLEAQNELLPARGVYVSRISLDGAPYGASVTNVGVRPTFGDNALAIETFVLAPDVPAHSATAHLQFLHRLRDERKFDSAELLRDQIARDVAQALKFFRMLNTTRHVGSH